MTNDNSKPETGKTDGGEAEGGAQSAITFDPESGIS
jgi:hypothetical protein